MGQAGDPQASFPERKTPTEGLRGGGQPHRGGKNHPAAGPFCLSPSPNNKPRLPRKPAHAGRTSAAACSVEPPHAGGNARLAPPARHPAPALHPRLVRGLRVGEPLPERGNLGGKLKVLPVLPENGETLPRHKTCVRNIHFFFFFLFCCSLPPYARGEASAGC